MSKTVEQSYFSVSRYFNAWVRLLEIKTRRMEVEDSLHFQGASRLIIAPPTDAGIPLLVRSNRTCRTKLLCFSERLKKIASAYSEKHGVKEGLSIYVAPYFKLPFADEEFAAIYANCFFDFCPEHNFDLILEEMHRVLQVDGSLFAVYMGPPKGFFAHGWTWAFKQFSFISQGAHPVSMSPYLSRHGFSIRKDLCLPASGFPLQYTFAEKQQNINDISAQQMGSRSAKPN